MTGSRIAVGKPAPAFALPDQTGKQVKLSALAGSWVVLYFYPKDDTPGCTTEACDFTGGLAEFEKLDAVVLGCSPDSAESHRKFIAKYGLKITLLSDVSHRVMESYEAWGERSIVGHTSTGVIRSTVLIDPEGNIAHYWPNVKAAEHAEKVRERLAEIRRG